MEIPTFENKKELYNWLIENKDVLITAKKTEFKRADTITANYIKENFTQKSINKKVDTENELYRKVVINTTNFLDSHLDVHIPGLWTKTLQENKNILFLQEHEMEFSKLIAKGKDLQAFTEEFNWTDLGYNKVGKTEALVFDVVIKKERNPEMFNRYKNNDVDNHSVGMRYVKLIMCINDEDYGAEFEAWEKYYPMISNKEVADGKGYFWAVTEAKIIEGSAVLIGSNSITPTLPRNEIISDLQKTYNALGNLLENFKPIKSLEIEKNEEPQNKQSPNNQNELNEIFNKLNKL